MAYRCKKCGYRFRSSDTDLCPECFTAREDNPGFDILGKGGNGSFGNNGEGSDFIADQLREESKVSSDELADEVSRFADSLKQEAARRSADNAYRYARQQYRQQRGQYYTGASAAQYRYQQPYNPRQSAAAVLDTEAFKKVYKVIIVIILAVMIFNLPGIFSRWQTKKQEAVSRGVSGHITRFWFESRADDNLQYGYDGLGSQYKHTISVEKDELRRSLWFILKCDVDISEGCKAEELTLQGFDNNGELNFSWVTQDDSYGTGNELREVPLCLTRSETYKITLTFKNEKGEKGVLYFKPDLNGYLEKISNSRMRRGINAPSVYAAEPPAFPAMTEERYGYGL